MPHRSRRRQRKFYLRKVRATPELPLSTLASDTALTVNVAGASTSTYRAISYIASWVLKNLTAGEGPITVGLAHSDYSVTEIKECLESSASIDPGLKVEQERANRLVRIVGTFNSEANNSLNDGKPLKTRLNWLIAIGDSVVMFAFNEQSGALATGAILHSQGNLWVKDSV